MQTNNTHAPTHKMHRNTHNNACLSLVVGATGGCGLLSAVHIVTRGLDLTGLQRMFRVSCYVNFTRYED